MHDLYEKSTTSNKIFLMKKLRNLNIREAAWSTTRPMTKTNDAFLHVELLKAWKIVRLSPSLEKLVFKSNNSLLDSIHREFTGLTTLKYRSLSQNVLNGNIPPELGKLDKLKHLDLSYNKLTGTIPNDLEGLKSLSLLNLSENKLQVPLPPSIGGYLLLHKLYLSFNNPSERIIP